MLQSLILIDSDLLLFGRRKKKKKERKKEMARKIFSQGQACLAGCAVWEFCSW
jgi:hypothetical protein